MPTTTVAAGKQTTRSAERAIGDCAIDGRLDGRYSTRSLLRALEILPADLDGYTNCRSLIEQRLLVLNRRPGLVIADCVVDGDLDRRYGRSVLRRALLILPSDVDEYTDCRRVIDKELQRQVKRAKKKRAAKQRRPAQRKARR